MRLYASGWLFFGHLQMNRICVCVEDVYCVVSDAGRASGHYGQTCKQCFIMFRSLLLEGFEDLC